MYNLIMKNKNSILSGLLAISILASPAIVTARGPRRNPSQTRGPHGLVARSEVRHVHPLGRLFPGRRRVERNHQPRRVVAITAKIPIAEYTELAKRFNPVSFNADEWVKVAKNAGMKYLVITAKHHDGFAMYNSPSDPYNIVKTSAYGRDPLKALSEACKREGLRFCVYYSLGRDWHDPDVPTGTPGSTKSPPGRRSNLIDFPDESKKDFSKYFERKVKPQVRELLTQYGPIGIMWFDTPERISKAQSVELLRMIRSLQPNCIVNVRIGNGLGDYGTPEQEIPSSKSTKPWETCMTLNGKWGYNKYDQNWKSTETLLRNLINITSKGGNYLLNVGPTEKESFPSQASSGSPKSEPG